MDCLPLTEAQKSDLQSLLLQRQRILAVQLDMDLHVTGDAELQITIPNEPRRNPEGIDTSSAIAWAARDAGQLAEVDHALAKFVGNAVETYGMCENCGTAIEYARLLAHPAARHCLTCQHKVEAVSFGSSQSADEGARSV